MLDGFLYFTAIKRFFYMKMSEIKKNSEKLIWRPDLGLWSSKGLAADICSDTGIGTGLLLWSFIFKIPISNESKNGKIKYRCF